MAWSPNAVPGYALGPIAVPPTPLPTTAYGGTGTSNAVKVWSANGNNRPAFSSIVAMPVGALSAGKLVLMASTAAGGSTLYEVDELAHASQSGYPPPARDDVPGPSSGGVTAPA